MQVDDLIRYLEKDYELKPTDLLLNDEDRMILVGEINLLDKIKDLNEKGFPKDEEDGQ